MPKILKPLRNTEKKIEYGFYKTVLSLTHNSMTQTFDF